MAAGADVLWRGIAGGCGAADPLIERSIDQGVTWTDVTPRYLGIAQVMAGRVFAGDQAEAVAAVGDDCEVRALRTFTGGQFWEDYDDVLEASTYIDPSDAGKIISPRGVLTAPCANARALTTTGGLIALTCEGSAYVSIDAADWTALSVPDAVGVAIDDDQVVVAHRTTTCAGVALTWFDLADAAPGTTQCAIGVDASEATAIAVSNERAFVWAGDDWVAFRID